MKHLKKFNEHSNIPSIDVMEDLRDICIDLIQDGFKVKFHLSSDDKYYRYFTLYKPDIATGIEGHSVFDTIEFDWSEIDETVRRMIDYLGDRLHNINYISRNNGSGYESFYRSKSITKNYPMSAYDVVLVLKYPVQFSQICAREEGNYKSVFESKLNENTRFRIGRETFKPSNFIELNSIGNVIDVEKGILYPQTKDGGYDDSNPIFMSSGFIFNGISKEDEDIVDEYWVSTETLKDKIDFSIIDKAKEISLEYIDDGFQLIYHICARQSTLNQSRGPDIALLFGSFNHSNDYTQFRKYFTEKMKISTDNIDRLVYKFIIIKGGSSIRKDSTYPESELLVKTLKNMIGSVPIIEVLKHDWPLTTLL